MCGRGFNNSSIMHMNCGYMMHNVHIPQALYQLCSCILFLKYTRNKFEYEIMKLQNITINHIKIKLNTWCVVVGEFAKKDRKKEVHISMILFKNMHSILSFKIDNNRLVNTSSRAKGLIGVNRS